jgi:hypothetical protein
MQGTHIVFDQKHHPGVIFSNLSEPASDSDAERQLYMHMINRALRDVINGAIFVAQEEKRKGRDTDFRANFQAETALGWIMDDSNGFSHKSHCREEPCLVRDNGRTFLCNSFKTGDICNKVTFQEACAYQEPPLSPEALREQLLRKLKQIWELKA